MSRSRLVLQALLGGQGAKLPARVATGKALGVGGMPSSSVPATPRSVEVGPAAPGSAVSLVNGGSDGGSFSPTSYGVAMQQRAMPFSSPLQPKVGLLCYTASASRADNSRPPSGFRPPRLRRLNAGNLSPFDEDMDSVSHKWTY